MTGLRRDNPASGDYFVPTGSAEDRLTVKGSRFVGWCSAAADEDEALTIIASRARQRRDATHNCWAFRVGDPHRPLERCSDEGEPSGTAGRPILEQLTAARLVGAVLVVSRWFGGTKLGKGGLARAYRDSAAGTIKLLTLRREFPLVRASVTCSYDLLKVVERNLGRHGGKIITADYGTDVNLTVSLPEAAWEAFRQAVAEEGGGRITIKPR